MKLAQKMLAGVAFAAVAGAANAWNCSLPENYGVAECPPGPPVATTPAPAAPPINNTLNTLTANPSAAAAARAAAAANAQQEQTLNNRNTQTVTNTIGNRNNNRNVNTNDASSYSGGSTVTNAPVTNYEVAKPMGNVAGVTIIPSGPCGEGQGFNLSIPFFGFGTSKTVQNELCLSQQAAIALLNSGAVNHDTGEVAGGIAALAAIHKEIHDALEIVSKNLLSECGVAAGRVSAVLLAVDHEGGLQSRCADVNAAFAGLPRDQMPPATVSPQAAAGVTVNLNTTTVAAPTPSTPPHRSPARHASAPKVCPCTVDGPKP